MCFKKLLHPELADCCNLDWKNYAGELIFRTIKTKHRHADPLY